LGLNQPRQIVPKVIDEEKEWTDVFKSDQFDLIISNMHLHWVNDLEQTLRKFSETLVADGLFMGTLVGGDSLQELRICLSLAESECEGGVSPLVSPMLSITDVGNILAKGAKFNMPTIDVTRTQHEFANAWQLLAFLRETGEQNCLFSRRKRVPLETFVAAAALYETLFTKATIG